MKRLAPVAAIVLAAAVGCKRGSPGSSASGAPAAPQAAPASPAAAPATPQAAQPGAAPAGAAAATPPSEAPVKPVPTKLPDVVARVNGEKVESWELEAAVKQAEANAGSSVPADQRDRVYRSILDDVVTYHMLAQEARAEKLTVTPQELDARIKMIRDMFPTEDAFKQALLLRGLTADRLQVQEERGLFYQKLLQAQVDSKVDVPDADVDAFYQQNIDKFKQGDTVHAAHIFFPVAKDATPAQKAEVKKTADDVLKQVKAGGDFGALAKKYSADTTAEQGGDLGFVGKGDLPPDFEAVAFNLKPGQTSDVVELGAGYHIIRVTEKRGPRTAPLAEVRNDVKAFMTQGKRQARLDDFVKQLKSKAKIEVLV